MKTTLRLLMLALVISFSSCQKDEIATEDETQKIIQKADLNSNDERRGVSCPADPGTLKADTSLTCFEDGLVISATPEGDENIPDGSELVYGLTKVQGSNQVIMQINDTPDFTVNVSGSYAIHGFVYDPNDFGLGIVVLGSTTVADVANFINTFSFCASLDPVGAVTLVVDCAQPCGAYSGTLSPDSDVACLEEGSAFISATSDDNMIVPDGYSVIYALLKGSNQVVMQLSNTSEFTVTEAGDYTINAFVYKTGSNYITYIQLGITSANIVIGYVESHPGVICASIDMVGAATEVISCID